MNWKQYWYNSVQQFVKGDLLEVGAGIGINTNLILQNCKTITSLIAIEPDALLSCQIKGNINANKSNADVKIHTGYLSDLDVSQKFDTIIYIDVIEHIENDKEEMLKAKDHLKDGGHLIILVPAYNFLFSPFDKAIGHFRRYNKRMLLHSVPNDLKNLELFYLDSLGACASLVNKLFLKQSYPTKVQIQKWDNLIVPSSKVVDKILFNSIGKSLIGVWRK
jgi:SAM-dependent methyltransferase